MALNPALLPLPAEQQVGPSKEQIERRKKWAQEVLSNNSNFTPAYGGPWEAVAKALQAGLGGYFSYQSDKADKANKAASDKDFNSFVSGLSPAKTNPAYSPTDTAAPAAAPDTAPKGIDVNLDPKAATTNYGTQVADTGMTPDTNTQFQMAGAVPPQQMPYDAAAGGDTDSFITQNALAESGNKNVPTSAGGPGQTAFGPHQITAGTWAGVMKAHPELQLTAADRMDPSKQDLVMREALVPEYRSTLAQYGLDPNEFGNMRAMHFLGAGGAKSLLTAPDSAPAARFVGAAQVRANKSVFFNKNGQPKTVAEVKEWLGKKPAMALGPTEEAGAPDKNVQVAENNQLEGAMRILGSEYATDAQKAFAAAILQKAFIPKDPVKLGANESLIDPNTGNVIYKGGDKPTAFEQNYLNYKAEEEAAGRTPQTRNEWNLSLKRAGSPNYIDPEQYAHQKWIDKENDNWGKIQESSTQSAEIMQNIPMLEELVKQAPSGPLTGRLATMFPGFSNSAAAMEAIVKRLAPQLRVVGSGSTSDIEYQGMLDAYPQLRNNPAANALITQMLKSKAAINLERSDIINQWSNGEITREQARTKMSELNKRSIMTPEMKKMIEANSAPGSFDAWLSGTAAAAGAQPSANQAAGAPTTLPKQIWVP